MADYIESFHKGLNAAKDAERNRAEVNAVFADLNEQLGRVTENKVAIKRMKLSGTGHPALSGLDSFFGNKYWALVAVFMHGAPDNKTNTEIAKWEQDSSGYPCRITIGERNYSCEDKTGLEEVLQILLADATVGEVLNKYMRMASPKGDE